MYVSTGMRHSIGLAASWLVAAGTVFAAIVYYPELKGVAGNLIGLRELQEEVADLQNRAAAVGEPQPSSSGGSVELQANRSGHFETLASINGSSIHVLVDTGATTVSLTYEDAERAGIYVRPSDFTHATRTANGQAKVAPVTIPEITIGDITVRDVRGTVSEPGKLGVTLLGMTFLGKLSRAEMRRGTLVLER